MLTSPSARRCFLSVEAKDGLPPPSFLGVRWNREAGGTARPGLTGHMGGLVEAGVGVVGVAAVRR